MVFCYCLVESEVLAIKILLVYPEVASFYIDSSQVLYGLAPPLGLLYIGSVLEGEGNEVRVVDFSAEPFSQDRLKGFLSDVDVVGITVLTPALSSVRAIIQCCRSVDPQIPIVIGGPHCTLFPDRSLVELDADVCVQGDGEQAFLDVVKGFLRKKEVGAVPGVVYRNGGKNVRNGPEVKLGGDVDSYVFPARHLVRNYEYGRWYNPRIKKGEFTSVLFSRGCPFRCRFCSRGAVGFHQFRRRSVSTILAELSDLSAKGYRYIAVNDDCFPTVKQEAMDLFDGIVAEGFDFYIYLNASRVNLIDRDLLKSMRQAGVVHIQFGLESGAQEVLDFYEKDTTVEQIKEVVGLSHRFGFFTVGSFILGAPIETKQHLLKTIRFAESLPLDSVSYLPLRYMAGSSLWEQAVSEGKIDADEYLVPADKIRGLGNFSYDELVAVCTNAQIRYYLRPRYVSSLFQTIVRRRNPEILVSFLKMLGVS